MFGSSRLNSQTGILQYFIMEPSYTEEREGKDYKLQGQWFQENSSLNKIIVWLFQYKVCSSA